MFSQASQLAILASVVLGPFWTVAVFLLGIYWTKNSSGYLPIAVKSILLAGLNFIPTIALELQQKWGFIQKFGADAIYMRISEMWVFLPSQFVTVFGILAGVHYFYSSATREMT